MSGNVAIDVGVQGLLELARESVGYESSVILDAAARSRFSLKNPSPAE